MRTLLALALFAVAGCSNGNGNGAPDMAAPPADMAKTGDMAILSQCGHPGDVGNSIGVGKFCMTIADCTADPNAKTNICSSLGNGPNPSPDDTYFCTIYPCHGDGGAGECGENATCVCAMQGCACTPNSCLGNPPTDGGATD